MGGTSMVMRPLVVAPMVGLVLGDLPTGLVVGASLELVFMGAMQIGAAVPPDVIVGAGLGTAFAIISGKGTETALALALPISILAQSIKVALFIVRSWFMDFAMKLAADANIRGLHALNFGGPHASERHVLPGRLHRGAARRPPRSPRSSRRFRRSS